MADDRPSIQDLVEELGFPGSHEQFLTLFFGTSDPFSGISSEDIESSRSRNHSRNHSQSSRPGSTSLAPQSASLEPSECDIPTTESLTFNNTSESREDPGGRDSVHSQQEWVALIAAESEALISELQQLVVSDDEAPLPILSRSAGSSTYDSNTGKAPDFVTGSHQNPGPSGISRTLLNPAISSSSISLEQILESFPLPPSRHSTFRERISPNIHHASSQVTPKHGARANISTLDSKVPLVDKTALGKTPASPSIKIPVAVGPRRTHFRSTSCSYREVYLPVLKPLRSPSKPTRRLLSRARPFQYKVFPDVPALKLPPRPLNSRSKGNRGRPTRLASGRTTPSIASRAPSISAAVPNTSKPLPPLSKQKRNFKSAVEKVKRFIRRPHTVSPFVFKN